MSRLDPMFRMLARDLVRLFKRREDVDGHPRTWIMVGRPHSVTIERDRA